MMPVAFELKLRQDVDLKSFFDAIRDGIEAGLDAIRDAAQANAPASLRQYVVSDTVADETAGVIAGRVGARVGQKGENAFVLNFFESGTKAHVIRPERGKFLVFEVGGRTVVTKKVAHPGMPPRPWLEPGFRTGLPVLEAMVADHLNAALAGPAKRESA